MDKLVSPYIDTEQYAKISLHPYQMTNDVNINLKINLKKKAEKRCNQNGFVSKIYSFWLMRYTEVELTKKRTEKCCALLV